MERGKTAFIYGGRMTRRLSLALRPQFLVASPQKPGIYLESARLAQFKLLNCNLIFKSTTKWKLFNVVGNNKCYAPRSH